MFDKNQHNRSFPFPFLGLLQREHPGIAISVKTRQAIRTILNNARDVIHELKGGGLLDEAEAGKLESVKTALLNPLIKMPNLICFFLSLFVSKHI